MRLDFVRASFSILLFLFATSAEAAQTFKVPISVVAGTVYVEDVAVEMPFSVPVTDLGCPGASGVFSAEIVDGAIETRFSGSAFGGIEPGSSCLLNAGARMDVELDVPEVGGSATTIRIEAEPIEGTFSSINSAGASMLVQGGLSRSSSVPGYLMLEQQFVSLSWNQDGIQPNGSQTRLQSLVPGDTIRFPVFFGTSLTGTTALPTQGTVRVRYVIRVTVPEPSTAVSVPLGALSLVGVAARRGPR